jgi:threonine/homoserine efflux transporter RhtA
MEIAAVCVYALVFGGVMARAPNLVAVALAMVAGLFSVLVFVALAGYSIGYFGLLCAVFTALFEAGYFAAGAMIGRGQRGRRNRRMDADMAGWL